MTAGFHSKALALATLSLVFSTLTLPAWGASIENGKLTKEALFDSSIPSTTIVQDIVKAGLNIKKAVSESVRMTPGKYFTKVGEADSFDYVPAAYKNKHAILYYIPHSIKDELYGKSHDVAPVLVIMHGGGASTAEYSAAKDVAMSYMADFIAFAEESKTILIAPSTSIGWNALASSFLIREINAIARKELNVSGDRFYLFGHSMGAMGMTRSTSNMVDEFAGFLPTAGGMEDYARIEANLRPYLNTQFTHINGHLDHFEVFKPRLIATEKAMSELAHQEHMPLRFKAFLHPGNHNYDLPLTIRELKKLFEVKRDLYQPRIFGYMGKAYQAPGGAMPVADFSYPHSFWAKASVFADPQVEGKTLYSHWNFEINQTSNTVEITNFQGPTYLKKVKIFLHEKALDFKQSIKIVVQGKLVLEENLKTNGLKTVEIVRERADPQFLFDQSLEVTLNK